MRNFLFGKLRRFKILTDTGVYEVGGRSYKVKKTVTIYDCFTKVATFENYKHIVEI